MQNRKSVIREDQKSLKVIIIRYGSLRKIPQWESFFELEPKASRKLGQVAMYLKGKANEKNDLILEAEGEA